jgi:hypothetical protein
MRWNGFTRRKTITTYTDSLIIDPSLKKENPIQSVLSYERPIKNTAKLKKKDGIALRAS